jgi:hypothetical protein
MQRCEEAAREEIEAGGSVDLALKGATRHQSGFGFSQQCENMDSCQISDNHPATYFVLV